MWPSHINWNSDISLNNSVLYFTISSDIFTEPCWLLFVTFLAFPHFVSSYLYFTIIRRFVLHGIDSTSVVYKSGWIAIKIISRVSRLFPLLHFCGIFLGRFWGGTQIACARFRFHLRLGFRLSLRGRKMNSRAFHAYATTIFLVKRIGITERSAT